MREAHHRFLRFLHRWLTLLFAPLLLLVLATGALLALQPVIDSVQGSPAAGEPAALAELRAIVERHDPEQRTRAIHLEAGGIAVFEKSEAGSRSVHLYRLEDGAGLGERSTGADLFRTVRHLHTDLLLDLDWLVEVGGYALLAILILGPWLAWPRLRRGLNHWHNGLGWLTLPLVLTLTVTGVLLARDWGTPTLPVIDREAPRIPVIEAFDGLEAAGVTAIHAMERKERSAWIVHGSDAEGRRDVVIQRDATTAIAPYPGWIRAIHGGTWAGPWSGLLNLLVATTLLFLLISGLWLWARRWVGERRRADRGAETLVAHASQTGTAARLAAATAQALREGGGRVAEGSLATLTPADLKRYRHTLFLVSTTGDGAMPDSGRRFLTALADADLSGVRCAVFALGDSSYRRFCAAGEALRSALRGTGAEEIVPMTRADGDPSAAWQQWFSGIAERLGLINETPTAPSGDQAVELTLSTREQLNDPGDPVTHEVWRLEFASETALDYRPGDLLLIRPGPGEPPRPYSIGSTPLEDPHRLRLTVAVTHRIDEKGALCPGKTSGLLCRQLIVGDPLQATLRVHESFRPPTDPARPMILIAAGCGIAPLIGFIAERACQARAEGDTGPIWLIYGNRRRGGDYFYARELEMWHQRGVLTRIDLAFSRDAEDGGYIQDRMREAGAELLEWLDRRDAILYACGKQKTVGAGVRAALADILCEHGETATPAEAARRIDHWEQEGRLRMDLIDLGS
ncbi:nitric oxide synthase [Halorhodospira abdelmalekii]|uniref:PepSY domain-containing protein n=1 Tax=Halorhodospira abdelmalekii TaxID=421629 RepID=UPI001908D116|nr:PepSY domain-containing protein [Halorhodospira abdelmalekii]MBK1735972.1 nitric oxide synthase [Halorhodospira abdelmalekii]